MSGNEFRQALIEKATEMGIDFPKNIKTEDLRKKISEVEKENDVVDIEALKKQLEEEIRKEYEEKLKIQEENLTSGPQQLTTGQKKLEARKKALKLHRVVVTCKDPMKQNWEGEIISAGNDLIGEVKKYIPFNNDEGWHIPEIILNVLKEKKCTIFVNKKGKDGMPIKVAKQINAYSIQELEPLSKEELEELARIQRQKQNAEI